MALTSNAVWPLAAIGLIVALVLRRWTAALLLVLGGIGGLAAGELLLKPLVARPRPSPELVRVLDPPSSYSFPSSTSLLAVVVVGATIALLPRRRRGPALILGTLVVVATGLARVYAGEHWPTDVVASWCFGGAWLLLLRGIWRSWPVLNREAARR